MKRNFFLSFLIFFYLLISKGELMGESFSLKSTAFVNNSFIPEKYSCDGTSPQLIISNIPKDTKSLILLIEDPDAKNGQGRRKTFIHLIAQFSPSIREIPEGKINTIAKKVINNDTERADYFGPCPPKGPAHSYFFTLVALDQPIKIEEHSADFFRNTWNYKNSAQTSRFYKEYKSNITGIAQLMGKFEKK